MEAIIRHKALPSRTFGACERCEQRPSAFYAVTTSVLDTYCGEFICALCVTPGSAELGHTDDMFAKLAA